VFANFDSIDFQASSSQLQYILLSELLHSSYTSVFSLYLIFSHFEHYKQYTSFLPEVKNALFCTSSKKIKTDKNELI
jgi:hypothetical protein